MHVAIVVSWDRNDWRWIMEIRLVKLPVVISDFTIIVDYVSQMIEERRVPAGRLVIGEVQLHISCNLLLIGGCVNAARVAHRVKYQPLFVLDIPDRVFRQDRR